MSTRNWRGSPRWGRLARWRPTPTELRMITVVGILLVLGCIGQIVLH